MLDFNYHLKPNISNICRAEKEKVMWRKDKKCFWEKVTKEGYLTHHPMGNFDGESCVTSRVPWEVVTRLSSGHLRSCPINGKQKTCRGDLDRKIQAAPFVDRIWDLVGAQGQRSAQFSAQPLSSKKRGRPRLAPCITLTRRVCGVTGLENPLSFL